MTRAIPLPSLQRLSEVLTADFEAGKLFSKKTGKEVGTNSNGYRQVFIDKKAYRAHRILWKMATGEEPDIIDHINRNKSDNRISNIRSVPYAENYRNLSMRPRSFPHIVGVYRHGKKWRADIWVAGRYIYLGLFATIDAAAGARKIAERAYGFHENHGRAI